MLRRFALLSALAAVVFAADDASAQAPFTFTVPVSVDRVHPDVGQILVMCRLFSDGTYSNAAQIGRSQTYVSMQGKTSHVATVTVPVDMDAGKSPWDVTHYNCTLYYTTPVLAGTLGFSTAATAPPHGRADPARPFTVIVSGTV